MKDSAPLAITALLAQPALARDPQLAFPVDCTLGETCHIQSLTDHDPTQAFADFTCGKLGYDGHKGTDIALPHGAAMARGVTVTAAAPGVVRGLRDGMADISIRDAGAPDVTGRECGNGVVIDHGGGWNTQYCHMRRGSIAVQKGQRVRTGTPLGMIGLSGNTEFPHLHFSVHQEDRVVDPFSADDLGASCGITPRSLWASDVQAPPGGLVSVGFFHRIPTLEEVRDRDIAPPRPSTDMPALVAWAHAFGTRTGDQIVIQVTGPDGFTMDGRWTFGHPQARTLRATGRKNAGALPEGIYRAQITLIRDGAILDAESTRISLTSR